ncbi:MAG: hypothetical protein WC770_08005 [Phycisphaerae bacterium]|jgi:hypothetical protein
MTVVWDEIFMECTVKKYLKIVEGTIADYKPLARFHYRAGRVGAVARVYKIVDTHPMRGLIEPVVGVIIYTMPVINVQMRNAATGGLFCKLGRGAALDFINANVRTIGRVVIEPRYRSLGLAHWLIEETICLLDMPYVEALAVMGKVNPFFQKAGMMKFEAAESLRSVKMKQALSVVGIEERDFVDIERVHGKLQVLRPKGKAFIEKEIAGFLAAYGRRGRNLPDCEMRTEFILSKLADRPVYYLWRNAAIKMKI